MNISHSSKRHPTRHGNTWGRRIRLLTIVAEACAAAAIALFAFGGTSAIGRLFHTSEAFAAGAPPLANFQGENTFTAPTDLTQPVTQRVYLKRETNCHLTSTTINSASPNKVVSTIPNYEDVLHAEALLNSKADVFPDGCPSDFPGASGQYGGAVERTAAGNYVVAILNNANGATSGVNVFVSNGSTDVKSTTNYPTAGTGSIPLYLSIADLGNGNGDIVVLDYTNSGSVVSVLVGNGDGTFKKAVKYPLSISAENLSIADVNGDGHLDVVAAGDGVQVLQGNGDGTLTTEPANGALAGIQGASLVIARFNTNNDNNLDLAFGGRILLGDGHGNFTAAAGLRFPSNGILATADFNDDGKADLALTDLTTSVTSIYLGNGDGTFTLQSSYAGIFGTIEQGAVDLDGDGNPDLVTGMVSPDLYGPDINTGGIGYYLMSQGTGAFAGVPAYVAPSGDNWAAGFAIGDFTGDKIPDVLMNGITPSDGSSFLQVLTGDGKGAFTLGPKTTIPSAGLLAAGLADPDSGNLAAFIASTNLDGTSGTLAVAFGNGDGTFQTPSQYSFNSTAKVLTLGNFNATGRGPNNIDAVVAGPGGVYLLSNDGTGHYGAAQAIAAPSNPTAIAAADVNKDGFTDLIVSDSRSPEANPVVPGSVKVYLGKGDGTFKAAMPISGVGTSPGPLAVGNVSGDGNQDLILGTTNPKTFTTSLLLFKGNGNGTFKAPSTLIPSDFGLTGIGIGDFNADGNPDLLITACCGATPSEVLLGAGNGTFPRTQLLPVGVSQSSLMVADLNGDNRPDAVLQSADFGVSAIMEVLVNGALPVSLPNPVLTRKETTVAFGKVFATGSSAVNVVTLTNNSKVAAVVGQATVPVSVSIRKDTCSNKTIKVTASCNVNLVYSPAVPGPLSGSLAVPYGRSSAQETLSATVTLFGNGKAATLTAPALVKFAATKPGTTKNATVTIQNETTVALTMGTLVLNGNGSFLTLLDNCSGKILKAKASCTDKLQFAPPMATKKGTMLTGSLSAPFTYGANIGTPKAIGLAGTAN